MMHPHPFFHADHRKIFRNIEVPSEASSRGPREEKRKNAIDLSLMDNSSNETLLNEKTLEAETAVLRDTRNALATLSAQVESDGLLQGSVLDKEYGETGAPEKRIADETQM